MRLRIGIVGYGGFGQFLQRAWSGSADFEVVAVAESNPGITVPGVALHRDWASLVRDPNVDVISIVTPPSSHAEIACAAMDAGKHVLIEKPLATTRADARRVIAAHADTSVVASVDYMLRFNPIVEVLQDWARRRPFGPLRRVLVENYAQDESLPTEHWFWDPVVSGGILVEHAVHFIDIVHGCTSPNPVEIDGFACARDDGRVDRMGLTAVYPDGVVMTQYHAFARPGFFESTSMRFVFDLAQVDIHGWIPLRGRAVVLATDATEAELERLPGYAEERRVSVREAADESRPNGWGEESRPALEGLSVRSGGGLYGVDRQIDLRFGLRGSKADVYAACVRSMMEDVVRAACDPDHRLRVTLQDGWTSLEVALTATETARRKTPSRPGH